MPRIITAILALALFTASLFFPAIALCQGPAGNPDWVSGKLILMFGWLGALRLQLGWLANLTFLVSILLMLLRKAAGQWLVLLHTALVLWAILPLPIMLDERGPPYAVASDVCGHGTGFWLWLLAQVLVIVSDLYALSASTDDETD